MTNTATWENRILAYKQVPVTDLLANPMNARRHPTSQRIALRGSLDTLGWVAPVIVNVVTGYMLDGHARAEELLSKDEHALIPVIEVQLTEAEEKLFLASFDWITHMAQYERENLDALLRMVSTDNAAMQTMLSEMASSQGLYFGEPPVIPEDDGGQIDRADELQAKWQVQTGDLWLIPSVTGSGMHRLLCGDSTIAADVARVMDGDTCEICFTSPPYADQRDYDNNDLSIETLVQFIPAAKQYAKFFCVNLGIKRKDYEIVPYWNDYIQAAKDCGLKLLSWNVWDKINATSVIMQMAMFAIQHEWIFIFGTDEKALVRTVDKSPESAKREKYYSKDSNGRSVTTRRQPDGTVKESIIGTVYDKKQMGTVLSVYAEMGRQADLNVHAARFPVELPSEYIVAMTNETDCVYDPFGGSGTTMVACEQLSRQCRMIEISEKYCAVVLERMTAIGCTPVKAN